MPREPGPRPRPTGVPIPQLVSTNITTTTYGGPVLGGSVSYPVTCLSPSVDVRKLARLVVRESPHRRKRTPAAAQHNNDGDGKASNCRGFCRTTTSVFVGVSSDKVKKMKGDSFWHVTCPYWLHTFLSLVRLPIPPLSHRGGPGKLYRRAGRDSS